MRITPVISHPLLFINTKSTDTEKPWFPALTLPRTTTSFLLTKGAATSKPLFRSARSGHKARQCFNRQNALRLSEYAAPVLPMRQKLPS